MPAAQHRAIELLPCARRRERDEPRADAAHRCSIPGDTVVRLAADGEPLAPPGLGRRTQTGAAADAPDGPGADLSAPPHERAASRAPRVFLPAARPSDRAAEPGLVRGRDLY